MLGHRARTLPLAAILAAFLTLVLAWAVPGRAAAAPKPPPAPVATLTSVTVDPEDATGATTNAPGAWSTNLADPLSQVGIEKGSTFLNETQPGITLGEVSIPLSPGNYTFKLYGTGVFPATAYYGLVLFFDGQATPPQVAVYNANPSTSSTPQVQSAGTDIMGGANGGLFFDKAPGTATYSAPGGGSVTVTGFSIDAATGSTDKVGAYNIGADGTPDMTAIVNFKVTAP